MVQWFFNGFFLANFSCLFEQDAFSNRLEEGRFDGNFYFEEIVLFNLDFAEPHLNFLFGLLKGLEEGVYSNILKRAFGLIVLNSFEGVQNSDGKLPFIDYSQLKVVMTIPEGGGGFNCLHILSIIKELL